MYLGINLSHGSSACLIDQNGALVLAIEEERLSRLKNHYGIPTEAIKFIARNCPTGVEISQVVHGSFQELPEDSFIRIISNTGDNPSNPRGTWKLPRPGWHRPEGDAHVILEDLINQTLSNLGISGVNHTWIKHHDAHLGTALATALRSKENKSLLITLDGEGDGESGTVAVSNQKKYQRLSSSSSLDSLGYLYQSVTEKYNFKGNQHEGKITGLAAFGKQSAAVEILASYIEIKDGKVRINYSKTKSKNRLTRALKKIGLNSSTASSLDEIIDLASSSTINYEDLAFAVQKVLEDSVVEMIEYWLNKTEINSLSAAGGVFANVKLNQRISDIGKLKFFDVFPNMGDGGLSAGGVWTHLSQNGKLLTAEPYKDMFLAPQEDSEEFYFKRDDLFFEEIAKQELAEKIAELVAGGSFIGLHYGRMEFGPRALGHRSLILDPRDRRILKSANERLRRTEFMPFAPVVLDSDFYEYFEGDLPNRPGFEFMTVTCDVRKEVRELIPAVTHVDGTARPQVVKSDSDDLYAEIIKAFGRRTGIYVLVNTSLNVHETPINFSLKDSIDCLVSGAIDYVATDRYLISLKRIVR